MRVVLEKIDKLAVSFECVKEEVKTGLRCIKENLETHPWFNMSQTTDGTRVNTRKVFFEAFGIKNDTAKCMLTGVTPLRPADLTVAHIMPKSAKSKYLECLSMTRDEVNSVRNLLLLCSKIEHAFDRLDISFVPPSNPFEGQFCLRIWNAKVRDMPIYEGASTNIGDYDNAVLNLSVNGRVHNPFKRAISYQAYHAYLYWSEYNYDVPELIDADISVYASGRGFREAYGNIVGRAIAEEV